MVKREKRNQKIKNNLLITLFVLVLTIIIIIIFFHKQTKNNYWNNYYEVNKKELNQIKDYIIENKLIGYIYLNKKIPPWWAITKEIFWWKLWECYRKKCEIYNWNNLLDTIKYLKIESIYYWLNWIVFLHENKSYNWRWFIIDNENFLYYWKWYFKNKNELSIIDWNKFHRIIKIFNDDWWVISWCYWCWFWAWD